MFWVYLAPRLEAEVALFWAPVGTLRRQFSWRNVSRRLSCSRAPDASCRASDADRSPRCSSWITVSDPRCPSQFRVPPDPSGSLGTRISGDVCEISLEKLGPPKCCHPKKRSAYTEVLVVWVALTAIGCYGRIIEIFLKIVLTCLVLSIVLWGLHAAEQRFGSFAACASHKLQHFSDSRVPHLAHTSARSIRRRTGISGSRKFVTTSGTPSPSLTALISTHCPPDGSRQLLGHAGGCFRSCLSRNKRQLLSPQSCTIDGRFKFRKKNLNLYQAV